MPEVQAGHAWAFPQGTSEGGEHWSYQKAQDRGVWVPQTPRLIGFLC